jgi:uncharacterized membrane-anchored protein YjiN (DUF445 family)
LRRMRIVATGLLVAMAMLFAATRWWLPPSPWVGAVRAFAEAALIGGLADWFAVTALFRHPLGLPIPHTAIVPRRKNQIGRALARFIRDHFLVREAIERRLASAALAGRFGTWLEAPGNAERVGRDLGHSLSWALDADGGGDFRTALGTSLHAAFEQVPTARALSTLLEVLTTGSRVDLLIDQLVAFGRSTLDEHRVSLRVRIHEQSPWWLPKFVDQEIYDKLVTAIEELLAAMATDQTHPARLDIKTRLESLKQSFASDPALAEKTHTLQEGLVQNPAVRAFAAELWQHFGAELRAALLTADSPLRVGFERELVNFGARLRNDPEAAAKLDRWLHDLLLYVVDNYRDPLSEIVSETIESWDAAETSRRIELNIGRDLQFIRVNGTLVGGLVGLLLYLGGLALA